MDLEQIVKKIYKRVILFGLIFIILSVSLFFLLNFYSQRLIKQIKEINELKENLLQKQLAKSRELELNRLALEIQQKTGKEISAILYDTNQKLERNLHDIKKIMDEKISLYGWKAQSDIKENELSYNLEIPSKNINDFYNFLMEELILARIKDFKIEKGNNIFLINLRI